MPIGFVLLIILVITIPVVVAGLYFYRLAIKREPKQFLNGNTDLINEVPVAGGSWGEGQKWIAEQELETIEVLSGDGLKLRAYYARSANPEGRVAILAHGYTGKGKDMGAYAKIYCDLLGCDVLLPDARAHGASEGQHIGFGWPERKDYLQWINYIIQRVGPNVRIVLHGVSMGGATVLMTSGEPLPPQVKAVVSDCAYTSVKAELSYQLRRMYKLPSFPFIPCASLVSKLKAGYFFGEASALKQVRKAKVPTLFIHGEADTFVPFFMMDELYEACGGPKARLTIPGAGHGTAYDTDHDGYVGTVSRFVRTYV